MVPGYSGVKVIQQESLNDFNKKETKVGLDRIFSREKGKGTLLTPRINRDREETR